MTTTSFPTTLRQPRRRPARLALWRGGTGVIGFVALLEVMSRANLVSPKFLPPFSTAASTAVGLIGEAPFLSDLGSTITTWTVGMAVAIGVGVPLGILLGLSSVTYQATSAVIELVRPMPAVALIPLVLLVAGQGITMKVIVALYAAIWPILFNAIYGVHGVDPKAVEMGRSYGLSRLGIIRRIVIPSAAPFIATGVRLSSSIVLIVIITVELIAGGSDGLGAFIAESRALGDQVNRVYAGILVTGLLGLSVNLALSALQRRFLDWDLTTRK